MTLNYKRILVAVNQSEGAELALQKAVATAKRNDARLDILRVIDVNSLQYKAGDQTLINGQEIVDIEEDNEKFLLQIKERLVTENQLKPEQVFVHLRFGDPKKVILSDFQPE